MAEETFDVVVIGGGVTGCGVALDAATRGMSVALLEQRDYASGTSSRSSKLFHGGLRYLQQRNFALVREALGERNLMLQALCPHLAAPVSFLYPLRHRGWERLYVGAGVLLYDLLAASNGSLLPRHRHLSRSAALALAPSLDPSSLAGAVVYWDALVDDARHTTTLARTAALHGARLANSTRVTALTSTGGRVDGALARDLEAGDEIRVRGRRLVNATGVWSDEVQEMAGSRGLEVTASKGIHLVVPRASLRSGTGLILRTETSVLLVVPWDRHWIIGTTDTPWKLGRAHPAASRADVDYLVEQVNRVLATPLTHDDVVGVYAGLRPLLSGESEQTSKLSREHRVLESDTGLITVAGGKYTTYRLMAKDAVDLVAASTGGPGSVSHRVPLLGAEGYDRLREDPDRVRLPSDPMRLLRRYGTAVADLERLVEEQPDLAAPLVGDAPYLRAEIVYAATHEGALHLDDVLTRRTRISIETRHRGLEAARPAAELLAPHLGWDRASIEREVEHYRARVEAELDSQRQPDDRTADAARLGAADVRTGSSE